MRQGVLFEHALRRSLRRQRRAVILALLGLLLAVIVGAIVYLSQAALDATTGRQLESLIAERNDLEQLNESLRAEIASLRSVPRLRQRAEELGFRLANSEDIDYVVVDQYDPRQTAVAPQIYAQLATPAPAYEETLAGWLQQQLDAFNRQPDALEGE
ncbi:MAG: hypothetical protein J4G17_05030 [Anaerolineae bacterium]|nr:hypothetical protein [Anaerolineae bacterium]